ncbi:MAG TPA: tetratricopeptide repeat protein, partial [Myxococcaceae bacterium]|nr:tetratricopeptide repeat protein [Myxococcaceae bacterium]
LGEIALRRSEYEEARRRYEEALPLYERFGDLLGKANCIIRLGDIALARSEHEQTRTHYLQALSLYESISEPYSIGHAHRCLARLAPNEQARQQHLTAAREAWSRIGRPDLVQQLDEEFGKEP